MKEDGRNTSRRTNTGSRTELSNAEVLIPSYLIRRSSNYAGSIPRDADRVAEKSLMIILLIPQLLTSTFNPPSRRSLTSNPAYALKNLLLLFNWLLLSLKKKSCLFESAVITYLKHSL